MSVGFAVADIANPIFADIVKGAERELRATDYSMLLTNSEGDADLDAATSAAQHRQVDGLLLSLTQEDNPATCEALRQACTLPMVLLDRDQPEGVKALWRASTTAPAWCGPRAPPRPSVTATSRW